MSFCDGLLDIYLGMVTLSPLCSKFYLRTGHGHFYSMGGFYENKWFQNCMRHGTEPAHRECGGRLSLTFRLTTHTAARVNFEPKAACPLTLCSIEKFVQNVSFTDVLHEIKPALQPDLTTLFGRTHLNNGRMAAELMHREYWPTPSQFAYSYGKKKLSGNPMGQIVSELCELVTKQSEQLMDWVHVTYYPLQHTKLGAHGDNESVIALGSHIACLTFMERENESRSIFIVGNNAPKVQRLL